jgi:polyhydroxybutyrate depolymerase
MRNETATWTFGSGRSARRFWPGLLCGVLAIGVLGAGAGCGGASEPAGAPEPAVPAVFDPSARLSELKLNGVSPVDTRPYQYKVPSRYDRTKPTPLLILLHGFGASGSLQEIYFNFSALAEKQTFLYAYPDGKQDPVGLRYWNAMEWCCDFFKSGVDDVAYIKAIIADMSGKFNVDPKRVFIVGHSNGGFMAHRIGCELSEQVAGVVSLAGAQWNDPSRCVPKQPIAVAQIHGTLDVVISYIGSLNYPSAHATVNIWANRNRCTGALTYGGENLDLDTLLLGAETTVERYTGCPAQGPVELWSIQGGSHLPAITSHFTSLIYDFLMAHPKP